MSQGETHKVALVGIGRWGKNILRTLTDIADVRYVAHSGSHETNAFLQSDYPQITIAKSLSDIWDDPAVTAVCIATPIETHVEIVRASLDAGKHTFVEKPLATSLKDVEELYARASEKNLTLFTGYVYLYDPAFEKLQSVIENKADLVCNTVWKKYGTFDSPIETNLLVHEVALTATLLGPILDVTPSDRNTENYFEATFLHERGTSHILIDREKEERKKILTVKDDDTTYTLTENTLTENGEILHEHDKVSLERELMQFLECTRTGGATNKKRQCIDTATASLLDQLKTIK